MLVFTRIKISSCEFYGRFIFCRRAWLGQIYSTVEKEVCAWTLEVLEPYQAYFGEMVFGSFRIAYSLSPTVLERKPLRSPA